MASLPIHPRLAHMIIRGKEIGRGETACELAALLEERDMLIGGNKKDVDLESRIDALHDGRGVVAGIQDRIAAQKRRLMEMMKIEKERVEPGSFGILLAFAYPDRIAAKRPDRAGSYKLSNGTTAALPAGSLLAREAFLAVADVDARAAEGKIYLASPVKQEELEKTFADEIVIEREVVWDAEVKGVRSRQLRKLGAAILAERPLESEGDEITQALLEGIRRTGLQCLPWTTETERFRERAQWARKNVKSISELPDFSDEFLAGSLEHWLAPFLGGLWRLQQLQKLDLEKILRSRLSIQQLRELDKLAPSHLQAPSGSRIAVDYAQSDHPALSVKLQELFGLTETPRVGSGTVPVTIHLLSPAGRPLAVTQDLHSFWQTVYPEIRKQLRARYPKHPWPENPLTATPTRKTIRRQH
jgi:ATP-dependent helicase HrpB